MQPNDQIEIDFQASPMSIRDAEKLINGKFLILAIPIHDKINLNEVEEIFKKMSENHTSEVQEIKLKCEMFLMQEGRRQFINSKRDDQTSSVKIERLAMYSSVMQAQSSFLSNSQGAPAQDSYAPEQTNKNITQLNQSSEQKKKYEQYAQKYEELEARHRIAYDQRQTIFEQLSDLRKTQLKKGAAVNIKLILQLLVAGYIVGWFLGFNNSTDVKA